MLGLSHAVDQRLTPAVGARRRKLVFDHPDFTGLVRPQLILAVDTEEDFDWTRPLSSTERAVHSMTRQHLAQSIFERHGAVPIYLCDYPVVDQEAGYRLLRDWVGAGKCAIGTQLHPWVSPPFSEPINQRNSYPCNLPLELAREKLRLLTDRIEESIGVRPKVYKAGRYGADLELAELLKPLGYTVDMSFNPVRNYGLQEGPDHMVYPHVPFWFDAEHDLLSIPLTADVLGLLRRHWLALADTVWSRPSEMLRLSSAMSRLGLLNRIALTPEGVTLAEAKRLTRAMLADGHRVFYLAYHSPSLTPGSTPYVRHEADLSRFLGWIDGYLEFFLHELGGASVLPTDLYVMARAAPLISSPVPEPLVVRPYRPAEPAAPIKTAARTIPTLFCINAGYAQHLAVCLVSLLENNPQHVFDITVVYSGTLGEAEGKLRRSVDRYRNCSLRLIPFSPPADLNLPLRAHYTLDIYTRLWIADFFPADVGRVLYLDSDLIVVGSISELWNADLGDAVLGAVTIPGSDRCHVLGMPDEHGYFNSGVLLVNLETWRRERLDLQLLDYIRNNVDRIIDPDQDALNACLHARRCVLPFVWNVISPFYFDLHSLGISESERRQVRQEALIVHFNGASKPWSYLNRHPRKADYYAYLRLTEWRDFQPKDRTVTNWAKKTADQILPEGVRAWARERISGGASRADG